MSSILADFAKLVDQLHGALQRLEARAALLKLPPLAQREWYEVLQRKLRPQLSDEAYLVVAVTGGTNIGKSVVFNHLAGFRASASSPLASGTKHPVCLVPPVFADAARLASIFPSFELRPWTEAAGALEDSDAHWLFWKASEKLPANLLLLDTPDIDSDAPVNWERADAVRQSADVLIAVLTQQKYNDAAVKKFFRKAAAEAKPAVVVFNQCELPEDEPYWPLWLQTFCAETGTQPLYVYVAGNDRKAAESLSLQFHERRWAPGSTAESVSEERPPLADDEGDASTLGLQEVFARLHFGEIKLRTLLGALRFLSAADAGAPHYLREVSARSAEFRSAAEALTARRLAEIDDWPAPPASLLIAEVREWWATQRRGWSAAVHGTYNAVGQAILFPFQRVREWARGPVTDPWEQYREREWDAIVRAVGKVYSQLEWLADLGLPLLKQQLDPLLDGSARAEVLRRLEADHVAFDFNALMQATVARELQGFQRENPQLFHWFRRLDEATAAARPVLTIVLGVTGVGLPFGEAATQLASHGFMQGAMHVAGDVVAGTATATIGETAISATASNSTGYLQAKFHNLQQALTSQRVQWLAERLERDVLGTLAEELQTAATVAQSAEFVRVQELLTAWSAQLALLPAPAESATAEPDRAT